MVDENNCTGAIIQLLQDLGKFPKEALFNENNDQGEEGLKQANMSKHGQHDDLSIEEQIQNFEAFLVSHELEDTRAKLHEVERDLELHRSRLLQAEIDLKEKEELISKLKLERDLAEAEKIMTKQQVSMLLDVKENLITGGNNAAQFYPIDRNIDDIASSSALESDLLNNLQNQLDLHKIILKQLETQRKSLVSSVKLSKLSCEPKSQFWKYYFRHVRKLLRKCRLNLRRAGRKKVWSHNKELYYEIQDCCSQEDNIESQSTMLDVQAMRDDDKAWLIDEIQSFDEKNQESIERIQRFLRSQSNRIHLLQHEMQKLIAMQIAFEDDDLSSTDDSSAHSDLCFSISS